MAEFYMRDITEKAGLGRYFQIASAATTTEEIQNGRGKPVYPPARKELARHGIGTPDNDLGVSEKRATLMKRSDYDRYDMLIGMDEENRYDMRRIVGGDPEHKISLLLDITDHPRDVADPWYTRDFSATWRDIEEGCGALLDLCRETLTARKYYQTEIGPVCMNTMEHEDYMEELAERQGHRK